MGNAGCVGGLAHGARRPEADPAMPDRDASAEGGTERPTQVDDGAADEPPGARLVETALEERERRHGERGEPAHGELAEDQEEAGAELRHPSLLVEGTRRDKPPPPRARPEPAPAAEAPRPPGRTRPARSRRGPPRSCWPRTASLC